MKNLSIASTVFSLAVFFASPVQAFPVWAGSIAKSHCMYLSLGGEWNESMRQAIKDNSHWISEIAENQRFAAQLISAAVNDRCPKMNDASFRRRNKMADAIGI